MRRILRRAFAGLLSLALAASGATLGFASHAAARANGAEHSHHADGHQHGHHAHHSTEPAALDDAPESSGEHRSKNCCSACTVVSPLPPVAETNVQLIASPAVYPSLKRFDVAHAIPIDPGIPKPMG